MSVERDIRFDLIARLCPNTTGAELRSVATEVRHRHLGAIDHCDWIPFRLACLQFVRDGRSLLSATSLTLWRRACGRQRSARQRKLPFISRPKDMLTIIMLQTSISSVQLDYVSIDSTLLS